MLSRIYILNISILAIEKPSLTALQGLISNANEMLMKLMAAECENGDALEQACRKISQLEETVKELGQINEQLKNQRKRTCDDCQMVLQQPLFCNSTCTANYYE